MTRLKIAFKIPAVRRAAAAFFLALCAATAPAAAQDFNSVFDGQGGASLAGLVNDLRSEEETALNSRVPAPSAAKPEPGNNEQLHFWEDLKDDVFDNICKQAQISLNKGADFEKVAGIDGAFKRYLRQFPDNKIGLVDEVGVKLDAGYMFNDLLDIAGAAVKLGFSAGVEGRSVVVRKLGDAKYCNKLPSIADLRKVKTILPVNEKRISGMKPGEIWKFPAAFRASISGGAGLPVQPWATISLSLGASREMKPSVTLFKMSEKALRLRIRLDRVTILRAGASAGTSFNAGMLGLPDMDFFLADQLEKTVVREVNKYLALRLGLSANRAKGKKILLEFVLDPRDQEQIYRLVDFLNGNLGIIKKLIEMGIRFNDFSDSDDNSDGNEALGQVAQVASDGLGQESSFAGSDHYHSTSHGFSAVLPLAVNHERSAGYRYDRYQTLDSGEVLHVHNAFKKESTGNLNIPVLGQVFKHNTTQNFYVINGEDQDGALSDAAVVYQRYEGYVKHNERDARDMVERMNGILKYAGTRGEGVNSDFIIGTDALFPRLAEAADGEDRPKAKRYGSAVMSFTLVFAKEAVRDITAAAPAAIMKAVLNVMEGLSREIVGKALHLLNLDGEGNLVYDWDAARKLLEPYQRTEISPLYALDNFCQVVTGIVADLAGVREAGDQKARSKRLSQVLAGKGESRIGYERLMQIFIQLVDVKDISASLRLKTDKRIKGEANLNNTYNLYNEDLQESGQLAAANSLRDNFAEPSVLSD